MQAGTEWLRWPERDEVARIVYEPRKVGEERHPENRYNQWKGWGAVPVRDDAARDLFLKLIDHLCATSEPYLRRWLLRWLAYPLQFPGTKLMTAVVIHGIQGGGESMLGYIMREVYGENNFAEITQKMVDGDFNPYAERLFVLADELISSDRRANRNHLKQLITSEKEWVNRKNVPNYEIVNRKNFLIVSNDNVSVSLEVGDRRFSIFNVSEKLDEDLRKTLGEMYRSERGRNAIMEFLLNQVDCKGFDIYADAPMSEAKRRMLDDSSSGLEEFIMDLIEHYDDIFKLGDWVTPFDFQTTETIMALYNNSDQMRGQRFVTYKAVGHVLSTLAANTKLIARLPQFKAAKPVNARGDLWVRGWGLRDPEQWRNTTKTKAKKHSRVKAKQAFASSTRHGERLRDTRLCT